MLSQCEYIYMYMLIMHWVINPLLIYFIVIRTMFYINEALIMF